MGNTAGTAVDVRGRLAHWKIAGQWYSETDAFTCKISDTFKINGWNWRLYLEKNRNPGIRIYLEPYQFPENQLLVVRFVLRVTGANCEPIISPLYEAVPETGRGWCWPIDRNWQSPFVISVEFLDFKISMPNGTSGSTKLPSVDKLQHLAAQSTARSLSHVLDDSVHADITIATSDGKLQAHKVILIARSPVFRSMFTHDLKEKISSTIEIKDMTSESSKTLLRFLYGSVEQEEFWKHRLVLLGAANKYDITDLKDACEESLLEDIDANNVLDRLQEAWLYEAGKLKRGCFRYLFDFGKIHHVSREEMHDFLRKADRELVVKMFDKMLESGIAPPLIPM
ncbi:hypothetical protein CASFOL_012570 [Castilleja foliolosa]|uniref:BTB domain-containing protein n=1 Tax=Castilleja foliolosa TaxID=1961234 RepID=A0ABD3DLK7_9LAMI